MRYAVRWFRLQLKPGQMKMIIADSCSTLQRQPGCEESGVGRVSRVDFGSWPQDEVRQLRYIFFERGFNRCFCII